MEIPKVANTALSPRRARTSALHCSALAMRPLISWAHGEADTTPLLPLGVTKSTWAATAEAAPSAARAIVLSAFLLAGPKRAGGSFARTYLSGLPMAATLWGRVDRMLRTSPGLCQQPGVEQRGPGRAEPARKVWRP